MMINAVCWIVTKPQGVELSALGIRAAWATHQFGVDTKLVFADDGVGCLTGAPGYHTTMLKELMQQEGEVFCILESLKQCRIAEDRILRGVQMIEAEGLPTLIEDCDTVNTL